MEGRDAVTGAPTDLAVPSVSLEGGVATVAVPPFAGGVPLQQRFAEAGRQAMAAADAMGVCGWVVDLSANTGGNMWPMLNAIIGILGEPPFGAFVSPEGQKAPWTVSGGEAVSGNGKPHLNLPLLPLKSSDAPLAVIIGPRTASSGEFTAMALRGRPSTVVMGLPSAGLVTANSVIPLSDGAALVVSTAWGEDRTGRRDEDRIYPDIATSKPRAAAAQWLEDMGCSDSPAGQLGQAGPWLRK
ncbi:MAG: S41 family peptidase [Alphaproteobacteria bacterium]|nr:S41 family peptidase [Alphaproteobacteria bacterium]